jgi:drug/metabolite transporter (DMT)-like permease
MNAGLHPFVVVFLRNLFAVEALDLWTWIGALIIFASAVYITRREAKLRRSNVGKVEPPQR